jgi:hypothetical protein
MSNSGPVFIEATSLKKSALRGNRYLTRLKIAHRNLENRRRNRRLECKVSALLLRVTGFVAPTQCTGEFVPVAAMKAYMESRIIAPPILNFGARSRLVFSITSRSFYLKKEGRYPSNGRLGGPQNRSVNFRKILFPLTSFESPIIQPVA